MSICVVVPMKAPARAKQRLSSVLPTAQREALALSLFTHTLAFFQHHFPELDVLVISEDVAMLDIARHYHCFELRQNVGGDLNDALSEAAAWVEHAGYSGLLIIPSDIAELSPSEIQQLLDQANARGVALAVAKDGGTNALLACPPRVIEFQFGIHSALAHQRECARKSVPVCPMTLPGLMLDIDQLNDLETAKRDGSEAIKRWQYA